MCWCLNVNIWQDVISLAKTAIQTETHPSPEQNTKTGPWPPRQYFCILWDSLRISHEKPKPNKKLRHKWLKWDKINEIEK